MGRSDLQTWECEAAPARLLPERAPEEEGRRERQGIADQQRDDDRLERSEDSGHDDRAQQHDGRDAHEHEQVPPESCAPLDVPTQQAADAGLPFGQSGHDEAESVGPNVAATIPIVSTGRGRVTGRIPAAASAIGTSMSQEKA